MRLAAHWVRGSSDPLPPQAAKNTRRPKVGSALAAGSLRAWAVDLPPRIHDERR